MKHSTRYKGVRYREHHSRKWSRKPDQYFFIRYSIDGKQKEEGLGWASEGWDAERANAILSELKEAKRTGAGAVSLEEKRERLRLDRRQR